MIYVSNFNNLGKSIPAGVSEIYGIDMRCRQAVIDILRSVYEDFGFDPLHTPILEHAETFNGHHGEGEKLLFKIQDSLGVELVNRYDLTVPLARFIATHPDISRPFKRYQIEPVFRDDKPDLGHFREFTQCDGDVIGDSNPTSDAEVINIAHMGLTRLGFQEFIIRVNHRGIIKAIAAKANVFDKEGVLSVQRALDFSDKVTKSGIDGIRQDLESYGAQQSVIDVILEMIMIDGKTALEKLEQIENTLKGIDVGEEAIAEMRAILNLLPTEVLKKVSIDLTLARGADYYTGFILEGIILSVPVGAVLGGGRYDNLVGKFCEHNEPAVGMAFGLERIMVALSMSNLLTSLPSKQRALIIARDTTRLQENMQAIKSLRSDRKSIDFILSNTLDAVSYATERGFDFVVEIINGGLYETILTENYDMKNLIISQLSVKINEKM